MALQISDLLLADLPIVLQDPAPAPHLLLVVMHFGTTSTHTVMSDEAIEHHLVASIANDHSPLD